MSAFPLTTSVRRVLSSIKPKDAQTLNTREMISFASFIER
jgi:hypothetical protein